MKYYSAESSTVQLKLEARELYIDSGRVMGFELAPLEVENLKLARHWIDKLLAEQEERERGRNAA